MYDLNAERISTPEEQYIMSSAQKIIDELNVLIPTLSESDQRRGQAIELQVSMSQVLARDIQVTKAEIEKTFETLELFKQVAN